jgi:hypothetical protein
MKTP